LTSLQLAEIIGIAVFAGGFGSLLGLGGGIILVPALIAIMRVEPRVAVAASVVSVIATSSAAAVAYVRDHLSDIRLGLVLEVTTTLGAILGAFVARYLSGEVVAGLFAALLVYSAVAILRPPAAAPLAPAVDDRAALTGSFHDPVQGKTVVYRVVRLKEGLAAGFVAGNLSAILGIGGGLVKVPVMATRMGVPIRVAVATSNFMIGVTAVATAIPYYASGAIDPYLAAPCALGVLVGARGGARLARRARSQQIKVGFALVLLYTAYTMARRAGMVAWH
jgi:uncharacterized protein